MKNLIWIATLVAALFMTASLSAQTNPYLTSKIEKVKAEVTKQYQRATALEGMKLDINQIQGVNQARIPGTGSNTGNQGKVKKGQSTDSNSTGNTQTETRNGRTSPAQTKGQNSGKKSKGTKTQPSKKYPNNSKTNPRPSPRSKKSKDQADTNRNGKSCKSKCRPTRRCGTKSPQKAKSRAGKAKSTSTVDRIRRKTRTQHK